MGGPVLIFCASASCSTPANHPPNVTKNQFKAKHNSQLLTKSSDLFERNVQQETGILATFGWFQLTKAL
jgi:hypothetical protein